MDIEGLNPTPNTTGWRFDTCAAPDPLNSIPSYRMQP
jgi:hypothetical protein